jgi:uncharacterized SAM-binding protein YcdF (DUF218 family)
VTTPSEAVGTPQPRLRLRRLLVATTAVLGSGAALWLVGLLWFAGAIPTALVDPVTPTDSVVVLTGGRQRLDTGLELLAEGKAKKLLVSGVHPGIELAELLRVSPRQPEWLTCCIVLGYEAESTRGNAAETAAWMRREGFRSLRLVTAAYHMPRSLLELHRAMPEVTIVPHPVFPQRVKPDWWAWPGTASLIVGEYHKYLAALVRSWLPDVA